MHSPTACSVRPGVRTFALRTIAPDKHFRTGAPGQVLSWTTPPFRTLNTHNLHSYTFLPGPGRLSGGASDRVGDCPGGGRMSVILLWESSPCVWNICCLLRCVWRISNYSYAPFKRLLKPFCLIDDAAFSGFLF